MAASKTRRVRADSLSRRVAVIASPARLEVETLSRNGQVWQQGRSNYPTELLSSLSFCHELTLTPLYRSGREGIGGQAFRSLRQAHREKAGARGAVAPTAV